MPVWHSGRLCFELVLFSFVLYVDIVKRGDSADYIRKVLWEEVDVDSGRKKGV